MPLYRFYVDARYRGEVDLELEDDEEAIDLADNDPDEVANDLIHAGTLPDTDVDFIQRYDEDNKRWVDVEEE